MQILFESSDESPSLKGLGIIPCRISRFDDSDKSVPHMGWNATEPLSTSHNPDSSSSSSFSSSPLGSTSIPTSTLPNYYYFVHSYCAKINVNVGAGKCQYPSQAVMEWANTVTRYGDEMFISSVRKNAIFGSQFHPEKSGIAGLKLIDEWLKNQLVPSNNNNNNPLYLVTPKHTLTKRIIACMDVRANDHGDLVVTKGDQYDVREKSTTSSIKATIAGSVRNLGKPVSLASKYYTEGADEICFLNITSFRHSPLLDQPMLAIVQATSKEIFVPLTIGGGIKDTIDPDGTTHSALEIASAYFRAGADKVSIGSEAVYAVENYLKTGEKGQGAIETIAHAYGKQAVVVSIDPKRTYVDPKTYHGPYQHELVYGKPDGPEKEQGQAWWYQCTVSGGREYRPLSVLQLAKGVEELGAGEILVNSIDRDGAGLGFDLDLINLVKKNVKIPVVASSGAGCAKHFVDVFQETEAEAALAAGIFHRKEVKIEEVKNALKSAGMNVRQVA